MGGEPWCHFLQRLRVRFAWRSPIKNLPAGKMFRSLLMSVMSCATPVVSLTIWRKAREETDATSPSLCFQGCTCLPNETFDVWMWQRWTKNICPMLMFPHSRTNTCNVETVVTPASALKGRDSFAILQKGNWLTRFQQQEDYKNISILMLVSFVKQHDLCFKYFIVFTTRLGFMLEGSVGNTLLC